MVRGLDLFRKRFKDHADQFVLIGGTACELVLEELGESFRATKDLDIVLCLESGGEAFAKSFWEFVDEGGYREIRTDGGKARSKLYRFTKPRNAEYPSMLELFSKEVMPVFQDEKVSPR